MSFQYPSVLPIWDVFEKDRDEWMKKYRSDQDFLMAKFPGWRIFPDGWIRKLGSFINKKGNLTLETGAKIILCMPVRNHIAARRYKLIKELWV
jgi:hypothetical protein